MCQLDQQRFIPKIKYAALRLVTSSIHCRFILKTRKQSKSLFMDHYFKLICKTTHLWTKLEPAQSSYNYSEPLGNFKYSIINNCSFKVTHLQI